MHASLNSTPDTPLDTLSCTLGVALKQGSIKAPCMVVTSAAWYYILLSLDSKQLFRLQFKCLLHRQVDDTACASHCCLLAGLVYCKHW